MIPNADWRLCFIILMLHNQCLGLVVKRQIQDNVCYQGNRDLELFNISFASCVDACRARVSCGAITTHEETFYCRLHEENDASQAECPVPGFSFSEKSSWQQSGITECTCAPGKVCNQDNVCIHVECPPAPTPLNGNYLGNQRKIGSRIEYKCDHGYMMTGTRTVTCLSDGTWSSPPPSCGSPDDCSETAPVGTNTDTPDVTSSTPGSIIVYQCLPGFQITSPPDLTLTCPVIGDWGTPPVCWKLCDDTAPAGTNTVDPTLTVWSPGSQITYSCQSGYSSGSVMTLTCSNSGSWGTPPICISDCPSAVPGGVNTINPTPSSVSVGSTAIYSCLGGYGIVDLSELTVTCNGGSWGVAPECVKVCDDTAPAGTNTNDPAVFVQFPGTVIIYTCTPGYNPQIGSQMSLTCLNDGSWGTAPTCVQDCPATAPPGNNTLDPTPALLTDGSTIVYTCITDFYIPDSSQLTLTCSGGSWGTAPQCVKDCPGTVPVGVYTDVPTLTTSVPGSTLQYQCQPTFQISSPQDLTLTCSVNGDWGTPPICWKFCDGTAPAGTNTVDPTVEQNVPGTDITYTCQSGYTAQTGSVMILTCSNNGLWGTPPICIQDCPSAVPGGVNTNNPTPSSVSVGSTATYSCLEGYGIVDLTALTVTCNGGSWSEPPPECIKVCDATAPAGTNTIDPAVTDQFPGTEIIYTCTPGYSPQSGSQMTLTCLNDGSWGTAPTCLQDCPAAIPPGNNTVDPPTPTSLIDGSTVVYNCITGFYIQYTSQLTLTCSGGSWGTAPQCIKDCSMIAPAGTNTNIPVVSSSSSGSTILYVCLAGYDIISTEDLTLTCSVTGDWGTPPFCRILCGITAPAGTNTVDPDVTDRIPGSEIIYSCQPGYSSMTGTVMQLTCPNSGTWGTPPSCIQDCPSTAPGGVNTNTLTPTSVSVGSTAIYSCLEGYGIVDLTALTVTCNGGSWSGPPPECIKVCDATAPAGTNTNDPAVTDQFPGTVITYTCTPGYSPQSGSQMSLTCLNDGSWGTAPTCLQDCPTTAPPGNNTVDPTPTLLTYGSTIVYTCITDFYIPDSSQLTLTCSGGSWGTAPQCIKDCPATIGTDLTVEATSSDAPDTEPGSNVTYACAPGFGIADESLLTLTCSKEGSWGTVPVCEPTSFPSTCTGDTDCILLNSFCHQVNKCFCRHDYKYNFDSHECLQVCSSYGNEYQEESGHISAFGYGYSPYHDPQPTVDLAVHLCKSEVCTDPHWLGFHVFQHSSGFKCKCFELTLDHVRLHDPSSYSSNGEFFKRQCT